MCDAIDHVPGVIASFSVWFSGRKILGVQTISGERLSQWRGLIQCGAHNEKDHHIPRNRIRRRHGSQRADIPLKLSKRAAYALLVDTLTITGLVEVGASGNPNNPAVTNLASSYGQSQFSVLEPGVADDTASLDQKATGYDFGFKFQAMYGSDARYTHFLVSSPVNRRTQSVRHRRSPRAVHLPGLLRRHRRKGGQYVTLEGAEVINGLTCALHAFLHFQFRHSVQAHRHLDDDARESNADIYLASTPA